MDRIDKDDYTTAMLSGTDQEIEFILDVLNLQSGSAILDLYCGYGRHALELAKRGFQIVGVDDNLSFLEIARQKAAEIRVNASFKQCDMRELRYDQQFDAVINMFAAFGFFSDAENEQVITSIHRALKPGGSLLIDLLNKDWILKNNLTRYWRHPSGDYVLSYKVEIVAGRAVMKRELLNQLTGAKTKFEFGLRVYSLTELSDMLRRQNFLIEAEYGGFDRRPYNSDAPRMIIMARKN